MFDTPNTSYQISEDAYLMPRDLIWKAYVDTWLSQLKLKEKSKIIQE